MWHNLTQYDSSIISACWVQFQNILTGAKLIFPDNVELVWFLKMNECHLPDSREQNIFSVQMCPLPRTRQLRLMTLQNRPFDFGGNINLYSILRLGLFGGFGALKCKV